MKRSAGIIGSYLVGAALLAALAAPALAAGGGVAVTLPYNRQVFSNGPAQEPSTCKMYDANPTADGCVPYFDLAGDALPAAQAPSGSVTVQATDGNTVTFTFPSVSGKDSLSLGVGQSQSDISVPAGHYSALDLLTGAGNGPAPLSITFNYSDGTTSTQTLSVPDWYKGTPAFAVPFTGRWVPGQASLQSGHLGLYALSVSVDPSKTLSSFSIQNTGQPAAAGQNQNTEVANILAATLEPSATASSASSAASSSATSSSSTKASSTTSTSTSSSSTSLPKTGGSAALMLGGLLLLAGGALTWKGKRA